MRVRRSLRSTVAKHPASGNSFSDRWIGFIANIWRRSREPCPNLLRPVKAVNPDYCGIHGQHARRHLHKCPYSSVPVLALLLATFNGKRGIAGGEVGVTF